MKKILNKIALFLLPSDSDESIAIAFLNAEKERMKWSSEIFTEATALSSLEKAKGEIIEMSDDIKAGIREPKEPADVIMCVFDSSGRHQMPAIIVMKAYIEKVKINKSRKWEKNADNTYSHIKAAEKCLSCAHDWLSCYDSKKETHYDYCRKCGLEDHNV